MRRGTPFAKKPVPTFSQRALIRRGGRGDQAPAPPPILRAGSRTGRDAAGEGNRMGDLPIRCCRLQGRGQRSRIDGEIVSPGVGVEVLGRIAVGHCAIRGQLLAACKRFGSPSVYAYFCSALDAGEIAITQFFLRVTMETEVLKPVNAV